MIVDGDGEAFFREVLADDVLIEEFLDLARRGDGSEGWGRGGGHFPLFLADDVVGQIDAIGADVDVGRAFDHGADITRRFSTKAAGGHASTSKTALGTAAGGTAAGVGTTAGATGSGATGTAGRDVAPASVTGAIGTCHRLAFLHWNVSKRLDKTI